MLIPIGLRPHSISTRSLHPYSHNNRTNFLGQASRKSGYLLTAKMPDGTSASLNSAKERAFRSVPPELRQTLTVDNGKEFSGHQHLSARLGIPVYFAHAYSSNERATNENTNGLLRQYFPKGTDFRDISHHELAFVTRRPNNRPRKRLNYLTPCEVLNKAGIALRTSDVTSRTRSQLPTPHCQKFFERLSVLNLQP